MQASMVLIFLCFIPFYANAGVYKWVDANGQTHFGDRPPAKAASSEVAVKAAPASVDAVARERHLKMTEFLEQLQEERKARQAADTQVEERAAKRAEVCRKLQARLKFLASVSTFYNLNDQGERVFVNEAENARIRADFRQKVKRTCGNE
ncbi:DUF4124 domain-containing protein [Marinobacter subterrani]|uniref:DUF4124 domain-containing protein n=1 Tax=Marinobacter subterrani TaxID=1658765 RepID=A0A0J7M723_9GAMM|nr:DUF4124 domain-containing protein [Marinobacter subterrani]KMQ76740.1 protein of unknown function (DUF4124) [Marinobacter subterrani]